MMLTELLCLCPVCVSKIARIPPANLLILGRKEEGYDIQCCHDEMFSSYN